IKRDHQLLLPASERVAVLEDYAPEPGGERAGLVKCRQIAERLDERLLRGIFGKVKITQNRIGVAHRHILKALDNGAKRFAIASLCSLDERDQRIHCSSVRCRRSSRMIAPPCAQKVRCIRSVTRRSPRIGYHSGLAECCGQPCSSPRRRQSYPRR